MEERVAELEEAHLAALNAAVRSVAADKDRERDIALASRAQEHARLVKDCEAELRERHEASLVMAQEKHAVAVKGLELGRAEEHPRAQAMMGNPR